MIAAYGYGLSASIIMTFWSLFYFAGEEMLHRSLDKRYDGATQAVVSVVELMGEFGLFALKPDVVITLVVGGLFGGWLNEQVGRRWA